MVFIAGSITMILFVMLAGVADSTPLNNTYFLSADTSGITGARDRTQWTYFYMCGPGNLDCSAAKPAPAFGSAWSANPSDAPSGLVGGDGGGTTSNYYYLMWRFGWVFYLIGLFFAVVALFSSLVACCGRLGSALAGFTAMVALFFYSIAAALMTAEFVKARDAFRNDGRDANIGTYAFGFTWGAWAALFIATVLLCAGSRGDKTRSSRFRRNKSVRSRRSVEVGGHRVKDEYE
ncbi:actin cortical patch SUR7/pH-response regulator pali [Xylariales sp. PMI_506]|nr:actin cortical patch SUR7/pH-response regulator pali [Xylariales sp. PMI_506]